VVAVLQNTRDCLKHVQHDNKAPPHHDTTHGQSDNSSNATHKFEKRQAAIHFQTLRQPTSTDVSDIVFPLQTEGLSRLSMQNNQAPLELLEQKQGKG
jgi:hypothetical protein